MSRSLTRMFKAIAIAACLATGLATHAADFPSAPVRIVVPFGAGGTTDLLARLLAEGLKAEWNQNVIVDNKPGAGGTIAASFVARAPADGLTLLLGTPGTQVTNKYLIAKLSYDPAKDFAPVIYVADAPALLLAHPGSGLRTTADLVNAARARPGQMSWASPGVGSTGHLMIEMFQQLSGTKVNHVPYKSGAQVNNDVMAGIVAIGSDNIPTALPFVRAGKMVALAVTGVDKDASLPEVDPVGKTLPGYNLVSWFVLVAPAGTPPAVVAELNRAADKVLKQPENVEKLKGLGAKAIGGTPQYVADMMRTEDVKLKGLIDKAGIKPE